jgi:RNA polymerase subunit RPABC4/transcription elongation factor Spt4
MCTGCRHYLFIKGDSDPHKCECGTTNCEAQRLAEGKRTGKCEAFAPGSAADKKAADNKHKGKFGIGAGLGQMVNGAFGRASGAASGEQIAIGAGKVALGGAALLGKGLFGLGKLAAKGVKNAMKDDQPDGVSEAWSEEDNDGETGEEAAVETSGGCDDPVALMAEKDGYRAIEFGEFAARDENEDKNEFKSGQRFKSVATVSFISNSDNGGSVLYFYRSESRDDGDGYSFKYQGPRLKLGDGDAAVIYYKKMGEGDFSIIEKIAKLSPLGAMAWTEAGGFAAVQPAAQGGMVCSCGAAIPAGSKFCPACGTPAPVPKSAAAVCSNCGTKLTAEMKFCPGCGTQAG